MESRSESSVPDAPVAQQRPAPSGRCMSTNVADHIGLLRSFARRYHRQLKAAKLRVEFDDIYGEMLLSFTKAVKGFKPERGVSFTAYLGRVCSNEFYKRLRPLWLEQYGRLPQAEAPIAPMETEQAVDPKYHWKGGLGTILFSEMEGVLSPEETIAGTGDPTLDLERRKTMLALFRDTSLSIPTRMYLRTLVDPKFEERLSEESRAMIAAKFPKVRSELEARFKIKLTYLRL